MFRGNGKVPLTVPYPGDVMTEVLWNRMTAEELRQKAVNDAIVCCPLLPPNNTGRRADIDLQTCVEPICRSRTLRRRNFSAASGSRTGLLDPDQAKNPERAEVCRCVVVWHDKFRAISW